MVTVLYNMIHHKQMKQFFGVSCPDTCFSLFISVLTSWEMAYCKIIWWVEGIYQFLIGEDASVFSIRPYSIVFLVFFLESFLDHCQCFLFQTFLVLGRKFGNLLIIGQIIFPAHFPDNLSCDIEHKWISGLPWYIVVSLFFLFPYHNLIIILFFGDFLFIEFVHQWLDDVLDSAVYFIECGSLIIIVLPCLFGWELIHHIFFGQIHNLSIVKIWHLQFQVIYTHQGRHWILCLPVSILLVSEFILIDYISKGCGEKFIISVPFWLLQEIIYLVSHFTVMSVFLQVINHCIHNIFV